MPSPKTKLDSKSWLDSLPQERANDQEFNLLLSKFKCLINEACDYRNLHSDCSVTRDANISFSDSDNLNHLHNHYPNQHLKSSNNNNNNNINNNNDNDLKNGKANNIKQDLCSSSMSPRTNGGQSVIDLRKKFFQQNDSGLPPVPSSSNRFKGTSPPSNQQQLCSLRRPNNSSSQESDNVIDPAKITKHHSSIHNLSISASVDQVGTRNVIKRPEIRQRNNQQANSRLLLLSKSSERLDCINDKDKPFISATSFDLPCDKPKPIMERQKSMAGISSVSPIPTTRPPLDDDTIYDAVSPDDLGEMPEPTSVRNYNDRLPPIPPLPSQSHGNRFDATRNTLGLHNDHGNISINNKFSVKAPQQSRMQPLNSFIDSNHPETNSSSSLLHDSSANSNNNHNTNHNDSSLSLIQNSSFKNQDYANYVNIDFFLKRSQSPSFEDGLEEDLSELDHGARGDDDEEEEEDDDDEDDNDEIDDDEDEEEDTTQLSHSISTDQICEDLRQLSPRDLARKLTVVNRDHQTKSSASITPASSGDFLDDNRSPGTTIRNQLTSTASTFSRHFEGFESGKLNSFVTSQNQAPPTSETDFKRLTSLNNGSRSSTTPRDFIGSKFTNNQSQQQQQQHQLHRGLDMIHEDQYQHQHQSSQGTHRVAPRQATFERDSSSHLDQLLSQNNSIADGCGSNALAEANSSMRSFLSDLNLTPVDDIFEDKAQRRIVKESFAVEYCGRRKLRHLFLFNDVIVCAKYQASSKQKFTFDVKWYLNLNGVTVSDVNDASHQVKLDLDSIDNQILAIRTNLMILRGKMQQIKHSKDKKSSKLIKKLKKKRTELEAELVLLLPHLPLMIKHINGKKYSFFLSSNFDRNQWVESIKYLQSQLPANKLSSSSPSSSELQAWIQTCRKNLNPSLGTFLLRSNCDDDLLYGDLYINLDTIRGIPKPGHYYFCFEVDSYGHFSQKASSVVLRIDKTDGHDLNDEYIFPLDGAHTLRFLLYEDQGQNMKPSVVGKAHIELSRAWCLDQPVGREIEFNSTCSLSARLSYSNSEILSMRVPHSKLCSTFGVDITQVCKKEKTQVPLLIQLCVNEVERRGMREVGIYRMSGTSTDIQRLKKAFDANPLAAELLLRDIDINSVTGFLKTYLREMPEGLFINKLYPKYVAAFNLPQSELIERKKKMLELYRKIPISNQRTISYLVDHLVKVNKYESYNKMSLTNLATVLGPNILRPPTDGTNTETPDSFTAVVIGSMSQAGILYFFLERAASNLSLTELSPMEMSRTSEA